MDLQHELNEYKVLVETELDKLLSLKNIPQKKIIESMRYSLLAGGKRIRPILAIKACELVGGDISSILQFACAIEMIHTYSLIHDDLPSMDDDDYRRGKLTNHKVFGEAIAILAGDGLLNLAYETIINEIKSNNKVNYIEALDVLSSASGINGMIGGQVLDILSEDKNIDKETLDFIHNYKTSALLEASLISGAIIGGGSKEQIEILKDYGRTIGLLFQIRDDILDSIGDIGILGKDIGSDKENNKSTYLSLYGLEKSIMLTKELCNKAKNLINNFQNEKKDFFIHFSEYLVHRES